MLLAFAFACLGRFDEIKVTCTTGGAPVEIILRDISQQTGIRYRAADRVRGEILIVNARDVKLADLLAQIAAVDGAEWRPDGEGFELTRSSKMEDAQAAAELEIRTTGLAKVLRESLAIHLFVPDRSHPVTDPAGRFAWRALEMIGPAALARVKSGTRVVYSTDPNPMQRQLPGNFEPVVQTFLQEYKAAPKESGEGGDAPDVLPEPVSRVLVGVTNSVFQGIEAHVYVYSRGGRVLSEGIATLIPPELQLLNEFDGEDSPAGKDAPLELPGTTKALLEMAKSAMAGKPLAHDPEVVARILDPAKYDPLGWFVGEALNALAKKSSRSVVASVPDFCFLTGLLAGAKGVTETSFRRWISHQCIVDETKPGWLTVKPRLPVEARELRTRREPMGAFYRNAWRNGGATVAELGAYIATQPRRYSETISYFYAWFCMPEIVRMFEPEDLGAIRAYGLLTESQREAMNAGKSIPMSLISPEARVEISDWLYNGPVFPGGMRQEIRPYVDPTDAFPNGLTMPVTLSTRIAGQDVVLPLYDGTEKTTFDASPLDAEALGTELGRQDVGQPNTLGSMTAFQLGKQLKLTLTFHSPHLTFDGEMRETHFDRASRSLKLEELPVAFRTTAQMHRANYPRSRPEVPVSVPPPTP